MPKVLAAKSMVLMKNDHQVLPLRGISADTPLLVAGHG
jgi:hypothetical protein